MKLSELKEGGAFPGCENEEKSSKPYSKGKKKYPGEEGCQGKKKNKTCKDADKR